MAQWTGRQLDRGREEGREREREESREGERKGGREGGTEGGRDGREGREGGSPSPPRCGAGVKAQNKTLPFPLARSEHLFPSLLILTSRVESRKWGGQAGAF